MVTTLDAYADGQHIGQFQDNGDLTVTFIYDTDAPASPISLSLPRDRPASRQAAKNFLANYLPDDRATRVRMAGVYGARSVSTFDLLEKSGGDIAGGLILLPDGVERRTGTPDLHPASDSAIAERIAAIKLDPDAWAPPNTAARFTLGGTQGKFALARHDGAWFWSNETLPSTHILKPARPQLRGLEVAETAAMRLASAIGISAAAPDVLHLDGQSSYIVERFDRAAGARLFISLSLGINAL